MGSLKMLDKHILRIEVAYQRNLNDQRVLALARSWSWVACGTITVAYRNGKYYVVDGQHRVMAARQRSDIQLMPCIVFDTRSLKEEAVGFYNANVNRTPLKAVEKLPSLIVQGDAAAILVQRLIEESGRLPGRPSGPNTVCCIHSMLKWAKNQPSILQRTWPLITEVCRGHVMDERILSGLLFIELHAGESLLNKRNYDRVMKVGAEGLVIAATRAAQIMARGNDKIWAQGIIEVLNKNCRYRLNLQ